MRPAEYRDEALRRLDFARFYADHGAPAGPRVGADEYRIRCPFHADETPSANFNASTGLWACHTCNDGGSPIDWLMKRDGLDYKAALARVGELAGLSPMGRSPGNGGAPLPPFPGQRSNGEAPPTSATRSKLTETNVEAWHDAALRNSDLMRWLHEHRGYTDETIERWKIGWDGTRVTIPVRDEGGKLVNVRRYKRDATTLQGKMLSLVAGAGPNVTTRLFPGDPLPDDVVLVEGEWDTILARQYGLEHVFTVTAGTGNWNPTLTPRFERKRVTIIPDNDEPGQKGATRIARTLSTSGLETTVLMCAIPNLPAKGDLTDFFVEQQRSVDELRDLLADASPFVAATEAIEEGEAEVVPLHRASDAVHRGHRLELPILLSGKAMTPYTVPYEMRVTCDMGNKRFCAICPMAEVNGQRDVTLRATDPEVLQLIGVPTSEQLNAIRRLAKAVPQCNRPQVEVKRAINIEELRLIPELDNSGEGDAEYVSRAGYFLGHGLLPNRAYRMRGYTHPHPKNQSTVHLLSEAEPAQDNVSAFALTPELRESLQVFTTDDVYRRFVDVYNDFAKTVHRIQDRLDMQVAYDLVWHSVVAFYFNGQYVRRGWVEAMVMGDSGQGKTEMAMNLLGHYGLGERVQGEQSSMAGLIGGLEKMGDNWILSWGRIPLNDKRLLVVDETQGLHSSAIEGLSDVRATGVAEITKIRTERTNARCRIIWLANPVSGLTLAQHNQGVLAIKELFKKPEDIRRLDFALAVASSDVDFARAINIRHDAAATPRYASELCRALVLWAWSRRPDQIEFTQPATDAILEAATVMGRRYHPSIPLVEPSDQRLKLARLAAATAARVYSTDDSGERLVVGRPHVDFVVDFLDRIYNGRSMAYGEYSAAMRKGEQLEPEEAERVKDEIVNWENSTEAIDFFRTARVFRKADLVDGLGWDDHYVKAQIRYLQGRRLIRPTREGYYKAPAFIALLRELTGAPGPAGESILDDPEAPF